MTELHAVDLTKLTLPELIDGYTGLAVEIVQTPKTLTPERSTIAADAERVRGEIMRRLIILDQAAQQARQYLSSAESDMLRLFKAGAHLGALHTLASDIFQLFLYRAHHQQQQLDAGAHRSRANM